MIRRMRRYWLINAILILVLIGIGYVAFAMACCSDVVSIPTR
jgi:hypothetical protein